MASAGSTCPAVPPPVTTANVASTRPGLPRRATLSSSPAAVIDTNSDDPPAEKNGSVRPVTGSSPATPPMLMIACTPNQVAMPPASSMPKRSGAASGGLDPEPHQQHEAADHGDDADEAELVGDHGEDEVAVGERQVAELAVAGADARAGEAAVGDRQEALVRLVRRGGRGAR